MTDENLAPCSSAPAAGREVSKATPSPRDYLLPVQELFGVVSELAPLLPLHDPPLQLLLQPAAITRPAATLTTVTAARTLRILVFFIESSMMANYP